MNAKILIVDDEKPTRDVMARYLGRKYACLTAADADAAFKLVSEDRDIALMISDVQMPGEDGLSLFKRAKAVNPSLVCIMVTAFGRVEMAVEAMRDGVYDFIMKPVDLNQLELRVAKALQTASLEKEVASLRSQLNTALENFTGKSPAMERVYQLIRKAAPSNATVLIEGPSGTGKELVAHALHNLSPRAGGPFVAVECSALSTSLLESELFGYEKNAFTGADREGRAGRFESANGGTLFLDEIGEIDASIQVKLLRALESRTIQRVGGNADIPVDFRLVAATNRDLARLVAEGRFREDLYYRLNVIDIHLPALRERTGDIALLVSRFLKEFSAANGGTVTGIDPKALKALEDYAWPGNVRQLRNVIEKMVILASNPTLTVDDLPVEIAAASAPVPAPAEAAAVPAASSAPAAGGTLADSEKTQILAALAACGNNKSRAAERLGISRRTLHRKLKEWNAS